MGNVHDRTYAGRQLCVRMQMQRIAGQDDWPDVRVRVDDGVGQGMWNESGRHRTAAMLPVSVCCASMCAPYGCSERAVYFEDSS